MDIGYGQEIVEGHTLIRQISSGHSLFDFMFEYERLETYQFAKEFYKAIRPFIKSENSLLYFEKNQLGRCSLSVLANIAEGNGTFSTKMKVNYFRIARGSISEAASIISVLYECECISKKDFDDLIKRAAQISRMLFSLIRTSNANP